MLRQRPLQKGVPGVYSTIIVARVGQYFEEQEQKRESATRTALVRSGTEAGASRDGSARLHALLPFWIDRKD